MQKEGNLTNTQALLTTLKGYEKLMSAEEREKFYKMIENFSYAESILNNLEEELEQQMTDFEDSQIHVAKTFEFIMNKFDEFIKKYDEMSKKTITMSEIPKQKQSGDTDGNIHQCGDECKCKKDDPKNDFKEFIEFLNSKEAEEFLEELRKHIMG